MNQPGPREIKGATILSPVNVSGHRAFTLKASQKTLVIYIARDDHTDALVDQVNSLVDKTVDIRFYGWPWTVCGKTGVKNYLQTIEESS